MTGWDDINDYTPNFECDRCSRKEQTKMGQIPIAGSFLAMSIRWLLCLSCHQAGWRPPSSVRVGSDKIIYRNITNGEKHYFTLKRKVPNSILQ